MMVDFLILVLQEIWYILKETSIFLLFGFALAEVLAVLVPARRLMRFFLEEPPPEAMKTAEECCRDRHAHHHGHPPTDHALTFLEASAPASLAISSPVFGRPLAVR
jgi:hypothetical protein